MIRKSLVVIGLLLSLGACDGYVVLLTLKEQQTAHDKPHRHTLYICGDQDVMQLLQGVAKSLNLSDYGVVGHDGAEKRYGWASPDGKFTMRVGDRNAGVWSIYLADWPDFPQSRLSKQVEAEIRHAARTSCSPT